MGATYEEVVADYMTTYVNYYHLEAGSEQYEAVKNSNIVSILTTITGAKDVYKRQILYNVQVPHWPV